MKKKVLSMIIAIVMVVGLLPATALSATTTDTWDGMTVDTSWHNTTDTAFAIDTAAKLAGLASIVNAGTDAFDGDTVTLAADIDLADKAWTPIGRSSRYSFKGIFDGAGYAISNLKIESDQQYVGMFGYVNGGTIKNVVLESPSVTASYSSANVAVGALVGYHSGTGNIEYCAVRNGAVSAPNSTCANTYSGLGGVVGCHNTSGYVIGCYNYMTAVSTKDNTMTRCGGVAGSVKTMAQSLYTYNTNQKGVPVVGGLASGSGTPAKHSAYLKADGTASSSISWSSYSVALSAEEFANGTAAYYLRTGAYSNVDNAWGQDVEGDTTESMPVWNGADVFCVQYVKNVEGTGTVVTIYLNDLETKEIGGKTYRVIRDVYDWVMFANFVNSKDGNNYPNRAWNAIVEPAGATIDFSVLGTLAYHNGSSQNVVTIGTSSNSNAYYNGTFNGNGSKIVGLKYESSYNYGTYSLFGYTGTNAHISNITVENASLTSMANHYLATFVRQNGGTLENCHAVNVNLISAKSNTGGIAYNNQGTIKNCSFSGMVNSGSIAGGISATAEPGAQFINCWNEGSITGKTTSASSGNYAGGILGMEADGVTIDHCYNTGDITGYYAGGIVGSCDGYGTVTNCHSYDATLSGTSTAPIAKGSGVSNCYYVADGETDSVAGTTYKTAEEFNNGTVAALLNGTGSVWEQGTDHPEIKAPVYYNITVTAEENGTVTVDKVTATEGEVITLTATPAERYALTSLTVTAADSTIVPVAEGKFTMPAQAVTVTAVFDYQKATLTASDFTLGNLNPTFDFDPQEVTVNAMPADLEAQYVTVGYMHNGTPLEEGKLPTNAGTYKVLVVVKNSPNYEGITLEYELVIAPAPANMTLGDSSAEFIYNGAAHTPKVSLSFGDATLTPEEAGCTVTYSNNINAGTATVTVSGNFEGTTTFEIKKATPEVDLGAPMDKVMSGDVMEMNPTTTALDNLVTPVTLTVLDGEGYSVSGNTITIDEGLTIGSTITVLVQYPGSANYEAKVTEHVLTIGVSTVDTSALEAEIEALKKAIADLTQQIAALQAEYGADVITLEAAVEELKRLIVSGDAADAWALADAVATLEQKINEAISVLKAADETNRTELEKMINTARSVLDNAIAELQNQVSQNEADIAALQAELAGKLSQLQVLIDTNTGDIETINRMLQSINEVLDALATKADVATEIAILTDLINDLADRIATNEANIDANIKAISALQSTLRTLAANMATQGADLAQSISNLSAELITLEIRVAANEQAIAALRNALDQAVKDLNKAIAGDATNAKALEEAVAVLENALGEAIAALEKADADNKAALEKMINEAKTALEATLAEAIDKLEKADADNKAALEALVATTKSALETAIAALEDRVEQNETDIAALKEALAKAIDDLNATIAAGDEANAKALEEAVAALEKALGEAVVVLEKADADNKAALEAMINEAKTALETAIAKLRQDLEGAVEDLENADKENAEALAQAIIDLTAAIEAAEAVATAEDTAIRAELAEAKTALEDAIACLWSELFVVRGELLTIMGEKDAVLDGKIAELAAALEAAAAASQAADAELSDAIEAAEAALTAAIEKVATDLASAHQALTISMAAGDKVLHGRIDDLTAALEAAIAASQTADEALKTELNTRIDEAVAALNAAIAQVQKNLDDAKAELTARDDQLNKLVVVAIVIGSVGVAGCLALVIYIIVDKRKKV